MANTTIPKIMQQGPSLIIFTKRFISSNTQPVIQVQTIVLNHTCCIYVIQGGPKISTFYLFNLGHKHRRKMFSYEF